MSAHSSETPRPHYFDMTVSGKIAPDDRDPNKLVLTTADGCQFRAAPLENLTVPAAERQWKVIPIVQTDGTISRFQIVAEQSAPDPEGDRLVCVGRTCQVSRKHNIVSLKIDRHGETNIRPTLFDPPGTMKTGQLWQFVAQRVGTNIKIVAATPIDESATTEPVIQPDPHPAAVIARQIQPLAPIAAPTDELLEIARNALNREVGNRDWELTPGRFKPPLWEWEARSLSTPEIRGRVRVNSTSRGTQVYIYPQYLRTDLVDRADAAIDPPMATPTDIDADADSVPTTQLIVTPLGAARGIGASCFRVQIGPYEIVLDAGTRPKGSDPLPAFELLERPDLLLITHAHADHIGAVPIFHQQFANVPIICTPGTREIAHVMLTDSLKVQKTFKRQGNEDFAQLFDWEDLDRTLLHLQTQPVGVDFSPLPGLTVRFVHAGHIVGAACIYLQYGDRSLLYTGDFNTTSSRTAEGLKLADLPQADILITESTYGADTHPSRRTQERDLIEAIVAVVAAGGNVLIPAFALGRAQEILLAIRTSALFHSLDVPVYVDGLVREVTDVFQSQLEFLPTSVQNFAKNQPPFFGEAKPRIVSIANPKERPLAMAHPSVIIASSGMLTGGASIYYAKTLLERENAAVFISGYTDEESPGRLLQNLEPGSEIELDGAQLTVRARIQRFGLSAHADRVGITQVIHRVNPQHLILIHGSTTALHDLSHAGDLRDRYWIHIPAVGDTIVFGQAPEHLSKAQIARVEVGQEFEIDIEAEFDGAWLRVPEEVLADPRWQHLTARGSLAAKWSKGGLMLRPTTHKSMAVEAAIASGMECCAVCEWFDGYICRGEASPLYKRDVDPTTKCGEFVRQDPSIESSGDVVEDAEDPASDRDVVA